MSLQTVRVRFRTKSNRHDLVDETGSDARTQGDVYLNAGQRWLDEQFHWLKPKGDIEVELEADDDSITLTGCIALYELWSEDSDGVKVPLTLYKSRRAFWSVFETAALDTGLPSYYCLPDLRHATPGQTLVQFAPPADKAYTLHAIGHFYEDDLAEAEDETYWSEVHPELLATAAAYILYRDYNNATAQKTKREEIDAIIEGLVRGQAQQETVTLEALNEWS